MDLSPDSSGHTSSHVHDNNKIPLNISCVHCRKRKIKCNRIDPCDPCQRSGIECSFRSRAPRSVNKKKGSSGREAELLLRLSRLEGLVRKIDPAAIREAREKSDDPLRMDIVYEDESPEPIGFHSHRPNIDSGAQYSNFVKSQESSIRLPTSDFWHNLSGEIHGLRSLLEEQPTDDADEEDELLLSAPSRHALPYFIFGESNAQQLHHEVPYPSDQHRQILYDYYFANVDPVCKIVNRVTAEKFLLHAGDDSLVDESGRYKFLALEAITFAMYFVSVGSLSQEQCRRHFQEDKEALLGRYRLGAEMALLKGDFLNSMNAIFLLAFVIYINGLRAARNSQSVWIYVGLAIRMCYSLGIHKDGNGEKLSAHEAETRRRLFWHIFVLDVKTSEDRGCEPMLYQSNFNIRLPLNIEDEDCLKDSPHPIPERKGFTSMTYSLMGIKIAKTIQKLHFVQPGEDASVSGLQEKENLAKECIRTIDEYFLSVYDPTNPLHEVAYMMSRILSLKLWLIAKYPMQRIHRTRPMQPREHCLRQVVDLLSAADALGSHEYAARFRWNFETSVSWHPLAVALACLCTENGGPLANEAWKVIDKHWFRWSVRIASSQEEKMWKPVKRLLKKAREARGRRIPQMGPSPQLQTPASTKSMPASNHVDSLLGLRISDPGDTPNTNIPPSSTLPPHNSYFQFTTPNHSIPAGSNIPEMPYINFTGTERSGITPIIWDPYTSVPVFGNQETMYAGGTNAVPAGEDLIWDDWNAFIFDAVAVDPIIDGVWELPMDYMGGSSGGSGYME